VPEPGTEPLNDSGRLPIHMGGLFRCCLVTWDESAPPASQTREGDVLPCSYCSASMIVRGGVWRWNRE
jgi:hypothetical protein